MNLNVQGMKTVDTRALIEKYMKDNRIDFAVLTETHITTNSTETRREFTWFVSGDDAATPHWAGVAMFIQNK